MVLLAMMLSCGCGHDRQDPNMKTDPTRQPAGLESDPQFYKLNSVMGEVTSGGKAIPGATITVVKLNETVAVEKDGTYVLVLDPERLGSDTHELLFSAPKHKPKRHTVTVPANNQVRLDVELEPERR
jgi:hypothetical protein